MSENSPESGQSPAFAKDATYRCVCGALISLEGGSPECPSCGRRYDSAVFQDATAETTIFDSDFSDGSGTARLVRDDDAYLGKRLGHFQILKHIGSGGMGTVYRALDESLQRYVALKVIHDSTSATNEAVLERLFQEARAQARVNHPHVAHIYYVGIEEDTPFLAMELVGDATLADRLTSGPLPFDEVIRYGLQMAEALAHASKFDIVHGDIKPSNVLLVDQDTVKISDFGLASRMSEAVGAKATAGTPDYMAPESFDGSDIDQRGDLYSLGVALFEMTFGKLPFDSSSTDIRERVRLVREARVAFPDSWPVGLPESWREVLARLLEKDPHDRYPDFESLIADLRRHQPVALTTASPLLRGVAWLFDSFIISSLLLPVVSVLAPPARFAFPLVRTVIEAAILLSVCSLQAWWGTTPGKRLFQIRIVDQHGLKPSRSVLGSRAVFQFLWAWATLFDDFALSPGLSLVVRSLLGIAIVFTIAELGSALFGGGRSLHDRILGTRVVLDAGLQPSNS